MKKNYPGLCRGCSACGGDIVVTEAMCKSRSYMCRPCRSRASVESAARHRETKRRNNAAYLKRLGAGRAKYTKRYRERHPERFAAHIAVQTAVRNGTLIPQSCEKCGAQKAVAHHDDYSRQLDVRWLCHDCHMAHHQPAMLKARTA